MPAIVAGIFSITKSGCLKSGWQFGSNSIVFYWELQLYLYSAIFYDKKGRVIQSQSTNNNGGIDIKTVQFIWAGQSLVAIDRSVGPSINNSFLVNRITYDDLGRMIKTEKRVGFSSSSTAPAVGVYMATSTLQYDALGQLRQKKSGARKVPPNLLLCLQARRPVSMPLQIIIMMTMVT